MVNFFVYIFYFYFILISILGFGFIVKNYFKLNLLENCFGYFGLIGISIILIYSYLSNLFFAHGKLHNFLFLLIGFIAFFYFIKNKFNPYKKEIIITAFFSFILLISIFIFKSHDDFAYYHFPYSYYLTEQKLVIGIGQILQGFRTPSSIFYFNSLLYLPYAEYYLFNFFPVYILGFANLILIKKIFEVNIKNKTKFINYLSLLIFIFINIFFYRIGEHGTDRSAQILIFILILEIFNQINKKKIEHKYLYKIFFLTSIIISLKAFYFLYLIFIVPIIIKEFKYSKNINKIIGNLILNKSFLISSSLIFLVVFSYFLNTGCLVYPVSFTCFENLSWAINKNDVVSSNNWFELWSKAGATPNYVIENQNNYIDKFNWVGNWINEYFFNKVFDFILGILALSIIVYFAFFKNGKINNSKKNVNNFISVYVILFILLFEWFYNHPALRYGGYCIISLILFIPISNMLQKIIINNKKYYNIAWIFIAISLLVFFSRNINRIYNENKIYNYEPLKNPSYILDKTHFRMQDYMEMIFDNYENCKQQNLKCDRSLAKLNKVKGYYIFLTKN